MAETPDEQARTAVLRLAVARVDGRTVRRGIDQLATRQSPLPATIRNSLNALRKRRDPAEVVLRPQYRAAVPFVALGIAEPPLARTVEELGDHADDPTREQLEAALAALGDEFPVDEIAVMLAHVSSEDMEASDICFELVTGDERFGIAEAWAAEQEADGAAGDGSGDVTAGEATADGAGEDGVGATADGASASVDEEDPAEAEARRVARRERKREAASVRRRQVEAEEEASRRVRRARRDERAERAAAARDAARAAQAASDGEVVAAPAVPRGRATAILRRPAQLTPSEEASFQRDDPLSGAVVFAWIPFSDRETGEDEHDEKGRRCVVVAGSDTEVLVRPGYSDGGVLAEDWRATHLAGWSQAGFDQPTVIDVATVRVPRSDLGETVGRLSTDDWNSLW